jgi:competence ComEA-like helix-hairpin-helix protein
MPGRTLAIAGIAALSAGAYFTLRTLHPGESPAVAAAAKCTFPVETKRGIECWDSRAKPADVRPGDRLDGDRVIGRMNPEAIATYEVAVDPNRADVAELASLPGIGPAMAQRIVDERAHGPFKSPEDLLRVKGIGEKTLTKLRPRFQFQP